MSAPVVDITIVVVPPTPITTWPVIAGPRGPAGPAGAGGYEHTQSVPMATWTIPHTLGHLPSVTLYVAGVQVDTDVTASLTQVVCTFAFPVSGVAELI